MNTFKPISNRAEKMDSAPCGQSPRHSLPLDWIQLPLGTSCGADEADEVYKQRVVRPYEEFNERIRAIRNLHETSAKPAAAPASKRKKKVP